MGYKEWQVLLVKCFNIITQNTEINDRISAFEQFMRQCDDDSLNSVIWACYSVSTCYPNKPLEWWKILFRQLLDFATNDKLKSKADFINEGQKIADEYDRSEPLNRLLYRIISVQCGVE